VIDLAALIAPVARWHDEYGFTLADATVREALARGAGGVLITDGPLAAATQIISAWREAAPRPIFIAAELGGGVGERFDGATALPPLAAFDPRDLDGVRRAARLTAREARAAGITWALAPSCVDEAYAAPIVRSRTLHGDDDDVAAALTEWIDACQAEGVVATPGPYPLMHVGGASAALDAGAGAILLATTHGADPEVVRYLREDAGFEGVIVAPVGAMADERGEDEAPIAVAALLAGCDLLLGVEEFAEVELALQHAVRAGQLDPEAIHQSQVRLATWTGWSDPRTPGREATLDDALWARRAADASVHAQRGRVYALNNPVDVVVIDDDPPRREPAGTALVSTLQRLGYDAHAVALPTGTARGPVVVALVGDRRIALGFEQYSDGALAQVDTVITRAAQMARDVIVVHFTPPAITGGMEHWPIVVCGWSGTRAMEEAVARWLSRAR
jgi:beta-glucosidase